jgi:5'-nucleotidase
MERPLILITNDDGITSEGLWAAVEAVLPLGDVLVIAPDQQWSGSGRCMPHRVTGAFKKTIRQIDGKTVTAYAVDASPALAVEHGILEFAPRIPDLVVSGINFGANLSIDVTISGTVGAALEASSFDIPALAASLEMDAAYHLIGSEEADYEAAKAYVRRFATYLLYRGIPHQIDVLNLNIPADAKPGTPWRRTHLSRYRYFTPIRPDREAGDGRPKYQVIQDPTETERDSDLRAVLVDRFVSLTPLSLDLTVREITPFVFEDTLTHKLLSYQIVSDTTAYEAPAELMGTKAPDPVLIVEDSQP